MCCGGRFVAGEGLPRRLKPDRGKELMAGLKGRPPSKRRLRKVPCRSCAKFEAAGLRETVGPEVKLEAKRPALTRASSLEMSTFYFSCLAR
jgi:hypothetical protein